MLPINQKLKFNIKDGVCATDGPMKGIYGIIIFYNKATGEYLVRFSEKQQLYYPEDGIIIWEEVI